MPLRSGTSTPWRQWEQAEVPDGWVVYLRDGHVPGSSEYLAEALRMDGTVISLGIALRRAEEADLRNSWYGYVDSGDDEVECSEQGETVDGEEVDEVFSCVMATVWSGG